MNDRREQREQTRRRVYEAALEVFRRDGVEGSRIEDIAELAGVSRPTFYFHFPTRQDVLRELLAESQQDLVAELAALPDETPIGEVLSRVAHEIGRRWKADPKLFAEVGSVAFVVPKDGLAKLAEQNPALLALLPRMYAAHRRGELDARLVPELLASFFLVNLFAATLAWTTMPETDLEALLDQVVVFFLKAARP